VPGVTAQGQAAQEQHHHRRGPRQVHRQDYIGDHHEGDDDRESRDDDQEENPDRGHIVVSLELRTSRQGRIDQATAHAFQLLRTHEGGDVWRQFLGDQALRVGGRAADQPLRQNCVSGAFR
jgi:hypothetical protein